MVEIKIAMMKFAKVNEKQLLISDIVVQSWS